VQEADLPYGFDTVNLGAWNDDPLAIAVIKERIDAQIQARE